jgi:hypothetical protein
MLTLGNSLRVTTLVAWLGVSALAAGAADPLAGWTFSNGHEFPGATGELKWNVTEGHDKPGCAEVRYSFDKGGNYVAVVMPLPQSNDARRVRLWLKKPGTNRITFRAADHTGQTFQKFVDYTYPGWQQIEVDLSHWVHSWGGEKDGKVRWPITSFGVLMENSGDARHGSYFIDDIEYLPGGQDADPSGLQRSTYIATTFTPVDGWHSQGPAGCHLRDGVWRYDLPQPGSAAGIGTDFPLFGDPKRLRLRVLSDGSGNELRLTLGSHFQSFEKSLGTLGPKGEQTFEAPVDSLADWHHFGGENDGVRRLPLRLMHLSLTRKGDQAAGDVKLLALEAETTYPPEQTVVLIPDGGINGGTAQFDVILRNLAARPLNGKLIAEIRDLTGRVSLKATAMHLPAGAAPTRQTVTAPMKNREFLEATFHFVTTGICTPEVSVTVTTVPEIPRMPAARTNPIGVGMYLYRQRGSLQYSANMEALAEMGQRAGVRWTREEFDWHAIEPEKGRYDWTFYDSLVRIANERGIQVYGLLCYWPSYTGSEKFVYTEAGVKEYARWAAEVVHHYKDRIKHWEIWNEPNIFFWSGPKELYIEALKLAYAAIKREDPDANVLGCSTAGVDAAFIKKVVDAQAPFDILTIHPYRGSLDERVFIDELKRTQQSVGGRPVWITEMGWPTCIGGTSERAQAGLVARTYLSSMASGVVGSVSWYDFRDDGNNPFYNEHRFGLIRTDLRPKAGYRALATIGRLLARHETAGPVDLGEDLLAFRFKASGRVDPGRENRGNKPRGSRSGPADPGRPSDEDVIALWSSSDDRAVALRTSPPVTTAFDAMGEPIATEADGRLFVTLPAGLPVYLVGASGLTVTREAPPASITAEPAIARPGEEVRIHLKAPGDWHANWFWPAQWKVTGSNKPGEWTIRVPTDQPQGRVGIVVEFEVGKQTFRIPLSLSIQPAMIRL